MTSRIGAMPGWPVSSTMRMSRRPQRLAHMAHQPQPVVLAVHHHVEQEQRNVRVGVEQGAGLGGAVGLQQVDVAALELVPLQCKRHRPAKDRVVIDGQHFQLGNL